MLIVTAIIAAVSGTPTIDAGVRTIAPVCQEAGPRKAGGENDGALHQGRTPATRPLGEEPNADGIAAVLYTEGRCSKPIVVSRNVGNNPKRK